MPKGATGGGGRAAIEFKRVSVVVVYPNQWKPLVFIGRMTESFQAATTTTTTQRKI